MTPTHAHTHIHSTCQVAMASCYVVATQCLGSLGGKILQWLEGKRPCSLIGAELNHCYLKLSIAVDSKVYCLE